MPFSTLALKLFVFSFLSYVWQCMGKVLLRLQCGNWKALISSIRESKSKAALLERTPEGCRWWVRGGTGGGAGLGSAESSRWSGRMQRLICCEWCECSYCFWKARGRITGEVVTDRLAAFQWQTKGCWSIWGERVSPPQRKCHALRLLLIMKMKNCILKSWQRCWQTVAVSSKLVFVFVPCFGLFLSHHSQLPLQFSATVT